MLILKSVRFSEKMSQIGNEWLLSSLKIVYLCVFMCSAKASFSASQMQKMTQILDLFKRIHNRMTEKCKTIIPPMFYK